MLMTLLSAVRETQTFADAFLRRFAILVTFRAGGVRLS